MKRINNEYVASATDIKRAQSHCNAIARAAAYDGCIEAWLNKADGTIRYIENIGNGYSVGDNDMKLLAYAYTPNRA